MHQHPRNEGKYDETVRGIFEASARGIFEASARGIFEASARKACGNEYAHALTALGVLTRFPHHVEQRRVEAGSHPLKIKFALMQ